MRKLALVLFGFILCSNIAYSQEASPAPTASSSNDNFRFGLFFAPNIGWAKSSTDGVSNNGGKMGFGFGLMAEFNLGSSNRYAFLTGLNVVKVNQSIKQDFSGAAMPPSVPATTFTLTRDIKTQYVEIPLALKLKTNEIGYLTYFGKFGITPGYRIKSQSTSSIAGSKVFSGNIDKQTTPIRLGLLIGIGTEFNISGSTNLSFGVDFNNGFTNSLTKSAGSDANGNKLKVINNYISLNLGIFF